MDIVMVVIAAAAILGLVALLVLLIRREIGFRRLPSDAAWTPDASEKLEAEAAAYAAQVSRGTGGIP